MANARYFELLDHIGREPSHYVDPVTGLDVENPYVGELQPAVMWTFTLATEIPVNVGEVGGEIQIEAIRSSEHVTLEPLRDTRIFEVKDPLVANAVAGRDDLVREIDPPTSQRLVKARKATEAARQRAPKTQEG